MSYVQKSLLPDERVVHMAMLHWIIYLQGLFVTIVGGVIGANSFLILNSLLGETFAQSYAHSLAGVGMVIVLIGSVLLLGAYVRQASTELAVTNRRIIAKYGFISRTTFEIMANRITGANFDQSIWGRLLGFGTVLIHGAGGDVSPFDNIAEPQLFQKALMSVLERAQNRG